MTISCVGAVLGFWMSLTPWHGDRGMPLEYRRAMLEPVAEVVCAATDDPGERAFLVAQAKHETNLAAYVVEGRCHEGPVGARCDEGHAWGVWQVHRWCRDAWDTALGTQERRAAAARCALRGWRRGSHAWQGPAGGFQAQRSAGPPQPWAHARVKLWRHASTVLRVARPPS